MYYAPAQTYLGTFESIKSVMFVLQIKKEVMCTDVIINGAKVVIVLFYEVIKARDLISEESADKQ